MAEHLKGMIGQAGRLDVSFNAVWFPQQGIQGTPMTELAKDDFVRPIAYTTSDFITATATAAARRNGVGPDRRWAEG